jgi:plastocyanin
VSTRRAGPACAIFALISSSAGPPAGAQAPATGRIEGNVVLLLGQGETAPGADAVVWIAGSVAPAGASRSEEMAQREKAFLPRVLAVPEGGTVRFPNLDDIYHNVFSRTLGQEFDLGLYRSGAARDRRFDVAGVVQVYCNIHAQMAAHVVVVDGDLSEVTRADGRFRFEGLAPGRHRLRAWQETGGKHEQVVEVRAGETSAIEIRLDASRWRPVGHKNKHGEDYPPASLDDDRY